MIAPVNKKATWKRRLNSSLGLRQQDQKREEIGPDIEAVAYRTVESLGTESRVQLLANGEPLIELYYNDRGWIQIEVQGVECAGVRVKLSAPQGQTVEQQSVGEHSYEIS